MGGAAKFYIRAAPTTWRNNVSISFTKQAQPIYRALFLAAILFAPTKAFADTDVTVADARDLIDDTPNIGPDCKSTAGSCTLRAAINRGNRQIGTHIIRLPAGTFQISRFGRDEDDGFLGDFDIHGKFIIIGAGAKSTIIDGNGRDRVFDVHSGSLELRNVTVRGGVATGGVANGGGGGIRNKAALTLVGAHLTQNSAEGFGGGIEQILGDNLTIVRSAITQNSAAQNSAIDANSSSGITRRTASIRETTIAFNTVTANITQALPALPAVDLFGFDTTEILHSTIARNSRQNGQLAGTLKIGTSNIVRVADVTISHTILDHSSDGTGLDCDLSGIDASANKTFTKNATRDASCNFSSANGNIVVNPLLGSLQDNGGQTPTMVFNNLSLTDAGDGAGTSCSGVDQRGLPRPVDFDNLGGAKCDIGAIELQGPIGVAVVEPENAAARKHQTLNLAYLWRVPEPQNWHNLQFLELRVRDDDEALIWLRWNEADNTFQLINPRTGSPKGHAFVAGSDHVLRTEDGELNVKNSSSVGSGPTGPEVTLNLALKFFEKSERKKPFVVEVAAADDSNQAQPFLAIGTIAVGPPEDR